MNLKLATLLLSSSLLAACVKHQDTPCYDPTVWPRLPDTCVVGNDKPSPTLAPKQEGDNGGPSDDNGGPSEGNGGDTPEDNGGDTPDDNGDDTPEDNGEDHGGNPCGVPCCKCFASTWFASSQT